MVEADASPSPLRKGLQLVEVGTVEARFRPFRVLLFMDLLFAFVVFVETPKSCHEAHEDPNCPLST